MLGCECEGRGTGSPVGRRSESATLAQLCLMTIHSRLPGGTSGQAEARVMGPARESTRKSDRIFFLAFAFYYVVIASVGFGNSTTQIIRRDGGLRTIAIVHGAFGASWFLLFLTQTVLINVRKRRLHMILGKAALPIMAGVFVTGIVALLRLHVPVEDIPHDLMISEVSLFTLGLIYAVLGITYRRNAASHKRYMLMSMILLSPAPVGRFLAFLGYPASGPSSMFAYVVIIFFIPLLAILAYDLIAYRKVFTGTAAGLALYALSLLLGPFLGRFVVDGLRPLLL